LEQFKALDEASVASEDAALHLPSNKRGEIAELIFMRKAVSLGFGVAKPWGNSERYDFILNAGELSGRVQVKSMRTGPQFSVKTTGRKRRAYRADEIDFLVAVIVPQDVWYVFPIAALEDCIHVYLRPFSRSRNERFRGAWNLLREPRQSGVI